MNHALFRMLRRAIIILSWLAGTVVVLLLALVGIVLLIDTDAYRPGLERELTHRLGREISAERLSIGFSLNPTIVVRELRVANPPWASRPYFLTASNIELTLNLIELLHGRLDVGAATALGLDLMLEQGKDGVGNWDFAGTDSASSDSGASRLPDFDMIALRNASVAWLGASGEPFAVDIEHAHAVMRSDKPFELKTGFTYRQAAIEADLDSKISLQKLLVGETLAASIALRSADTRVDLEVAAPRLADLAAASVNFAGKGGRLDSLSELAGRALPGWGPYRVSGTAAFSGEAVELSNLRLLVEGLTGTPSLPISRVEIDSGNASAGRSAATSLQIAGTLDENRFRVELTTADFTRLAGGPESIPLTANVTLADFELGINGTISRSAQAHSFDLMTRVRGDVGAPARVFGSTAFTRPVRADISGRITGNASEVIATNLRGTIADCTVVGDLTIGLDDPRRLDGTLKLGRLDITAFEVEQDKGTKKEKGVEKNKVKQQRKRELTAAEPQWMQTVEADVQMQIDEVIGLPVPVSNLSAQGTLRNGRLEVRKFRGVVNKTSLAASVGLQWKNKRPYVDARISVPVFQMSNAGGNNKAASNGNDHERTRNADHLDAKLPLDLLRMFDADVTLQTGRIKGLPVSVTDQRGSARLRRGHLRVPVMDVTLVDIPVRSTFMLDASRDDARLSATLSSKDIDVTGLLKPLEVNIPLTGKIGKASTIVDTHGITLRDWVSNAKVAARVETTVLKRQDRNMELTVEKAKFVAGPGVNAHAESHGKLGDFPADLTVTGGPLADLLDGKKAWPKVVADLRMMIDEKPLRVTASSALDALRRGRNVPVRLDARSSNAHAVATGTIADLREPARSPLDVKVSVKSLAALPLLVDKSRLPDVPFAVDAKAVLDDGLFSLEQMTIQAGETDLSGQLRLLYKDRIKLVAELSGKLLDLKPWVSKTTEKGVEKGSEEKRAAWLDQPFYLDAIRENDAEVRLKAQRVVGDNVDLDDFTFHSRLENGQLKLLVGVKEGDSKATLHFDARNDVPVAGINASTKNLDRDALRPESAAPAYKDAPRISALVQLAGRGTTPREVFASSQGNILIHTGPGRVRTTASSLWVDAISSDLLETLTPGKKTDDYNSLECAAAYFSIADGVASSPDGIALRFKRMDLLGSGAINLSTREILFGFKAVRRKWWSFSFLDLAGDFASIGGTIDKPKVGLSPGDVIVQGGAAWATLGISLLATNFFRKLNSAEDPCAQIVEKGRTASTPIDDLLQSFRSTKSTKPNKPR